MEILLVLTTGALCIACFFIGVRTGQRVSRGQDIKIPTIAEVKREREEKREADLERDRLNTILENIDNYDGTSVGQKDIPRR